jgi:3-oxoacyl-[acyl-carrier-protein] synthase III
VIRSDIPIARRYQATLFSIGGRRWRTGIAALAEIAAGAFAQSLLDLPVHPRLLDLVALDTIGANMAVPRIAARIAEIGRLEL